MQTIQMRKTDILENKTRFFNSTGRKSIMGICPLEMFLQLIPKDGHSKAGFYKIKLLSAHLHTKIRPQKINS